MEINKGTVLVRPNKPIVFCSNDWNDGEDLKYSLGIEISKILKHHREFQKGKSLSGIFLLVVYDQLIEYLFVLLITTGRTKIGC